MNDFNNKIKVVLDDIADLLAKKNSMYGNSALHPLRIFSKAQTDEQLFVRIDDKLSRISTLKAKFLECTDDTQKGLLKDSIRDTIKDLIGYLTILMIL
jgi:hypothetical protein